MNLPRQTAQTNSLIAELVGQTEGLPPGVANTITGGHVTGDVLVRSPDVPTISFTGSTATGKQISATAAENLKRVGLELGGKTPLILFQDADLQHEVFGPVLVMQTFATEAEAIAMANDSDYGLSASVFSRDVDVPLRVALALESGSVWVNDWAKLHDQFEEGGFKGSGVGRMRGFAVMDDFIEFKHIRLQPGTTPAV
jgi:acyl-CoA reductase-like NAD-dependent aldehyde dehydrogenase